MRSFARGSVFSRLSTMGLNRRADAMVVQVVFTEIVKYEISALRIYTCTYKPFGTGAAAPVPSVFLEDHGILALPSPREEWAPVAI